jgi:hypothetical protein
MNGFRIGLILSCRAVRTDLTVQNGLQCSSCRVLAAMSLLSQVRPAHRRNLEGEECGAEAATMKRAALVA